MLSFDNGLGLIIDRIAHPRARLAVYRLGNLEIAVDRTGGDLASIRACLATPMYRRLLSAISLPNKIKVLDIGANVGGFPLLLVATGFTFDRLVAVELNPNTSLRLQANLATNLHRAPSIIRVINAGVWFEQGNLTREFGWGNTGDTIQSIDLSQGSKMTAVPLRTVDDVIQAEFGDETIDLCKIDIEGSEYDVFERAFPSRLKQVTFLIIEIHARDGHNASDVIHALGGAGFTLERKWVGGADLICLFRNARPTNTTDIIAANWSAN